MSSLPLVPLVPLVALLRAELSGYGGLLALFDQQQAHLLAADMPGVADTSSAIENLATEAARDRAERERWVARFATEHDFPAETHLRRLLAFFPTDQQPLLSALMDEINHLLQRTRRRARQNHTLLARALELHREIIATLHPAARPRTYAPTGRIGLPTTAVATLQATG